MRSVVRRAVEAALSPAHRGLGHVGYGPRLRRRPPDVPLERPPVRFVLFNAYGVGGTIRTVFNTAGFLAGRGWPVEVVSVVRRRTQPAFPVHPDVTLTPLVDLRGQGRGRFGEIRIRRLVRRALHRTPSLLWSRHDGRWDQASLLTDWRLVRCLRAMAPGVLVLTRPGLAIAGARFAPPHLVTVGQEHLNLPTHKPGLRAEMERTYPRLDALTVLTSDDEHDYAAMLAGAPTRVVRIPNAATDLGGATSDLTARVVVAIGRLYRQKGFDRLVTAYARAARDHPDWQAHIYGEGPLRATLQARIDRLGLPDRVRLMGRTSAVGQVLAEASVYVLSSRFEGFPMVVLEAMSAGVPVVAFDCPRGPADLIESGRNGILVPDGDIDALAAGIRQLIEDVPLRRRLGAAAADTAASYAMARIGAQWEDFLHRLVRDVAQRP